MASPTQDIYYRGSGNGVQLFPKKPLVGPGDQYLEWLSYVLEKQSIPQTIAMGYSTPEPSIPPEYAFSLCDLLAQLGARGASVFVASGNFGVGKGDRMTPTEIPDFTPPSPHPVSYEWRYSISLLASRTQAQVQVAHQIFPGPWVTSVGGTFHHIHTKSTTWPTSSIILAEYEEFYKCVRSRGLTQSTLSNVISAALGAAVYPTWPCNCRDTKYS